MRAGRLVVRLSLVLDLVAGNDRPEWILVSVQHLRSLQLAPEFPKEYSRRPKVVSAWPAVLVLKQSLGTP